MTLRLDFRQNHFEHAQLVDQEFLHIDLHPKDGFLEMNEFTTFFADLDTDGIYNKLYQIIMNVFITHIVNFNSFVLCI